MPLPSRATRFQSRNFKLIPSVCRFLPWKNSVLIELSGQYSRSSFSDYWNSRILGQEYRLILLRFCSAMTYHLIRQPFLTPVPPLGSDLLAKVTLPLRLIIGLVRTTFMLLLVPIYLVLVPGLCIVFVRFLHFYPGFISSHSQTPVPPLHRAISHLLTSIITRTGLLLLGFFWISVETVTRKRGQVIRPVIARDRL
jgi:hypothetical protein